MREMDALHLVAPAGVEPATNCLESAIERERRLGVSPARCVSRTNRRNLAPMFYAEGVGSLLRIEGVFGSARSLLWRMNE